MQGKHLLERAKRNRRALGPFETCLWSRLSRSQLEGHKFRRQHVIGNRIVDFFCPAKALIVEVDGETHEPARDAARDCSHLALGYATLRFSNAEVGGNIDGVLEKIVATLHALPERRWTARLPHPDPSPEGEGTSMT